jgi:soluble cytochrome b562
MPYTNPQNRVRLNKTEAEWLISTLDHALQCSHGNCAQCKAAKKLLNDFRNVIYQRNR